MGHYDLPSDSEVIERLREQVSSLVSQQNGIESKLAEARAEIVKLNDELVARGVLDNQRMMEMRQVKAERAEREAECEALRAESARIIQLFRSAAAKVNTRQHNVFADAIEAIADILGERAVREARNGVS